MTGVRPFTLKKEPGTQTGLCGVEGRKEYRRKQGQWKEHCRRTKDRTRLELVDSKGWERSFP